MAAGVDILRFYLGYKPDLIDLERLNAMDFRGYLVERNNSGLSRSSIARAISSLRNFFQFLEKQEVIQNSCIDDLNIPDARILRPQTLIIHDNHEQKIYYIVNCFSDEKITNYKTKYDSIENEISNLIFIANYDRNIINNQLKKKIKIKKY